MKLDHRGPLDFGGLLAFFAMRAVPGVEEVRDGVYRRVLTLDHGHAIVELSASRGDEGSVPAQDPGNIELAAVPGHEGSAPAQDPGNIELAAVPRHEGSAPAQDPAIEATLHLDDDRDRPAALRACRALLDLDADPAAIVATLGDDPLLGAHIHASPGLRVPGHPDPHELAVRAVLGQQVSVAAARTLAGRLADAHGAHVDDPHGTLTRTFPTAAALAAMDPADLAMPRSRANALLALTTALASGDLTLTPDTDPDEADAALQELPGIGPWTAAYARMRALGDRDVFLPTDLGVRRALESLGQPADPRSATTAAEAWRPYRSYALMHLWARLADPRPRRPDAAPGSA